MGNPIRISLFALHVVALAALWALFRPGPGLLGLALLYAFVVWAVAGGIMFGAYLVSSLAPFSNLMAASLVASSQAMWLVPGALALGSRSPLVMAVGVAIIANTTRLLTLSRPPKGRTLPARHHRHDHIEEADAAPPLFAWQPAQAVYFSPDTLPGMVGALLIQAGIYALYGGYPFPAAVSFATTTALWVSTSVSQGALKTRRAIASHSAIFAVLTLLLTLVLTAVLLNKTIVQEIPPVTAATELAERPGITTRVLRRLAHVPPVPMQSPSPAYAPGPKMLLTTIVDPAMGEAPPVEVPPAEAPPGAAAPNAGEKQLSGIPGVVLRPPPAEVPKILPFVSGSPFHLASGQSLAIPFTGEYQLFRTSSGSLPKGAPVEFGTPLGTIYGTTNGGPMNTVAVQNFDPPVDLTNCAKILVGVNSAEQAPALVTLQLVTAGSVEDGGSDLLGMKRERRQILEFHAPATSGPLLVRSLRISFQSPLVDSSKNVRIEVTGFTFQTRGF